MTSRILRSLLVTLGALALVGLETAGVSASTTGTGTNMTITVPSSASVTARVAVPLTVQVTCTAPDLSGYIITYPATVFFNSGGVSITQALGQSVTTAIAGFGPVTCDGNTYSYSVLVVSGTSPFHGGKALVQASASWNEQWGGCLISDPTNCGFFSVTDSASVVGTISL